jgi:hypothetical protein
MAHRWLARILARKRELRRNRRGTTIAGSVFQPGTNETSSNIQAQQATLVVGPAGSLFPITSTAASGGAAAVVNAALVYAVANNIGIVQLKGGPNVTYWLEGTIVPIEGVNLWSDGATLKAMNGAAFSPLIGNGPTQTLTSRIYLGLSLSANAGNSGFTAKALTISSGVALTYPLSVQSSMVIQSTGTGTVTAVTQNGRTMPTTGPWFVTPTDTTVITWTGSLTWAYTQQIDCWWTYNTNHCRWIHCEPFQSGVPAGQTGAGIMFTLDTGTAQISSDAVVEVSYGAPASNNTWCCAIRINGSQTYQCANHLFIKVNCSCNFRGVDIPQYADSHRFEYIRCAAAMNGMVGVWLGSGVPPGTWWSSATAYTTGQVVVFGNITYQCILGNTNEQPPNATYWLPIYGQCDRVAFGTLFVDNGNGYTNVSEIVAGYYNSAIHPSPSTYVSIVSGASSDQPWEDLREPPYNSATAYVPGNQVYYQNAAYQCIANSTGNLPSNATYWVQILSSVNDFDIVSGVQQLRMRAITGGQTFVPFKGGWNNQIAVPASGVPTPVFPFPVRYHIQALGTVTQVTLTDPEGNTRNLLPNAMIIGESIFVPPGATLTLTYSSVPTWVSYRSE